MIVEYEDIPIKSDGEIRDSLMLHNLSGELQTTDVKPWTRFPEHQILK